MSFVTRLALRMGVVVLLAVALLFGIGVFAATQVQQDLLPDISIPAVIVITADPGASPAIVDTQVSVPVVNAPVTSKSHDVPRASIAVKVTSTPPA